MSVLSVASFFLFGINPPDPLHPRPSLMATVVLFFLHQQQSSESDHVGPLLPNQPEPLLFATYIFQKHIVVFSNVNRKTFFLLHCQMHQSHAFIPFFAHW